MVENKIGISAFGEKTEPFIRHSWLNSTQRMSVMINNGNVSEIKFH
jgi:hypothetical protein